MVTHKPHTRSTFRGAVPFLASLLVLATACGSGAVANQPADDAHGTDAGSTDAAERDDGTVEDTGIPSDIGIGGDAGVEAGADVGEPIDGMVDAGPIDAADLDDGAQDPDAQDDASADSGSPVDAGSADVGDPIDGGAPIDAGTDIDGGDRDGGSSTVRPAGIYTVVVIDNPGDFAEPGYRAKVSSLLDNPAISGVVIRAQWRALEQQEFARDFTAIDVALEEASSRGKDVQLILVPGFWSPPWLLGDDVRLPSCEPAIANPPPVLPPDCGKALFWTQYGPGIDKLQYLPLPWSGAYKTAWHALLQAVAVRYAADDGVKSIAVAGPTSVSAEMSLPGDAAKVVPPGDIDELTKWSRLLGLFYSSPAYHDSNQAIIDEWNAAIDDYSIMFQGKTVVVTRGAGLLAFHKGDPGQAKDDIITHFTGTVLDGIRKSTQTSGMKACRNNDGGIGGVKELTGNLSYDPRILGGAMFYSAVSNHPEKMGCQTCDQACTGITAAEALKNILAVYFEGTKYGPDYGSQTGDAQIHYLQLYANDIVYAASDPVFQSGLLDASRRILSFK